MGASTLLIYICGKKLLFVSTRHRHPYIDCDRSSGLYPIKDFPAIVGGEASGTIVGLPHDADTLNHEVYKRQNYKIGAKVVVVCLRQVCTARRCTSGWLSRSNSYSRTSLAHSLPISPFRGNLSTSSPTI